MVIRKPGMLTMKMNPERATPHILLIIRTGNFVLQTPAAQTLYVGYTLESQYGTNGYTLGIIIDRGPVIKILSYSGFRLLILERMLLLGLK